MGRVSRGSEHRGIEGIESRFNVVQEKCHRFLAKTNLMMNPVNKLTCPPVEDTSLMQIFAQLAFLLLS
jgi:hypothetical protein